MLRRKNGRAAGGKGKGSGLMAVEEEACLRWQWKLYSIHVRVIKVTGIKKTDVFRNVSCRHDEKPGAAVDDTALAMWFDFMHVRDK